MKSLKAWEGNIFVDHCDDESNETESFVQKHRRGSRGIFYELSKKGSLAYYTYFFNFVCGHMGPGQSPRAICDNLVKQNRSLSLSINFCLILSQMPGIPLMSKAALVVSRAVRLGVVPTILGEAWE